MPALSASSASATRSAPRTPGRSASSPRSWPDGSVEEAALGRARQLVKKPVAALLQTRGLLKGNTGALCDRIDQEISLFQQALQDDTTLQRLQRIARLAA